MLDVRGEFLRMQRQRDSIGQRCSARRERRMTGDRHECDIATEKAAELASTDKREHMLSNLRYEYGICSFDAGAQLFRSN